MLDVSADMGVEGVDCVNGHPGRAPLVFSPIYVTIYSCVYKSCERFTYLGWWDNSGRCQQRKGCLSCQRCCAKMTFDLHLRVNWEIKTRILHTSTPFLPCASLRRHENVNACRKGQPNDESFLSSFPVWFTGGLQSRNKLERVCFTNAGCTVWGFLFFVRHKYLYPIKSS